MSTAAVPTPAPAPPPPAADAPKPKKICCALREFEVGERVLVDLPEGVYAGKG